MKFKPIIDIDYDITKTTLKPTNNSDIGKLLQLTWDIHRGMHPKIKVSENHDSDDENPQWKERSRTSSTKEVVLLSYLLNKRD